MTNRPDQTDWVRIASAAECPPGTSIERVVAGRVVALANVAGNWHAIDGLCPHQGGPLGTGMLCGAVLTCPWHGWQFDVTTGAQRQGAAVANQPWQATSEIFGRGGQVAAGYYGAPEDKKK
jgi:nitrite reductase/ring-hydroxylating ferredoxin subunit